MRLDRSVRTRVTASGQRGRGRMVGVTTGRTSGKEVASG